MRVTDGKATRLFIVLAGFFLTNALLAEFVGVKIFSLESTLGIAPIEWSLLGITGNLNFTAGVLLWPFVFVMTDVINEYFGPRGVRLISWIAVAFICYAFFAAYASIALAPAGFHPQLDGGHLRRPVAIEFQLGIEDHAVLLGVKTDVFLALSSIRLDDRATQLPDP